MQDNPILGKWYYGKSSSYSVLAEGENLFFEEVLSDDSVARGQLQAEGEWFHATLATGVIRLKHNNGTLVSNFRKVRGFRSP